MLQIVLLSSGIFVQHSREMAGISREMAGNSREMAGCILICIPELHTVSEKKLFFRIF